MSKKKSGTVILLSAAVMCGVVGLTSAYLIHGQYKVNTFTIGNNVIDIVEDYDPPEELTTGENTYKKKVQIQNTGNVPCFVRVFAEFSDSEIEASSQLSPDGSTYYPADEYEEYLPEGWVYLDLEEDPLLGGYYYYTSIVGPNMITVPLFEEVKTSFETADEIKEYDIIVYSESVQSKNSKGEAFNEEYGEIWKQAWTEFMEGR